MSWRYRSIYVVASGDFPGPQRLVAVIDDTLDRLRLRRGDLVSVQVTTPGTAAVITYYGDPDPGTTAPK